MDMVSDSQLCVVMCVDVDPGLKSIHLAPGPGVDSSPSPDAGPSAPPRQHRSHRSGGARDDRYRSGTTNTLTLALTLITTLHVFTPAATFSRKLPELVELVSLS